jgi:hypothetical protein
MIRHVIAVLWTRVLRDRLVEAVISLLTARLMAWLSGGSNNTRT